MRRRRLRCVHMFLVRYVSDFPLDNFSPVSKGLFIHYMILGPGGDVYVRYLCVFSLWYHDILVFRLKVDHEYDQYGL